MPHAALESRIGHRFRNAALLTQALTHASASTDNNERLEFLGDGVLGCVIAQELLARFPALAEGRLTQLRAALVREETLAEVAERLGLGAELVLEAPLRPSMLADALEALFGAVFLDGGYDAARAAIVAAYGAELDSPDPKRLARDAKTRLQELMQARRARLPEYRVVAQRGQDHERTFEVECLLPDAGVSARQSGTSKLRAEQAAAQMVLEQLERT